MADVTNNVVLNDITDDAKSANFSDCMYCEDDEGNVHFVDILGGGTAGPEMTHQIIWVVRVAEPVSIAQPAQGLRKKWLICTTMITSVARIIWSALMLTTVTDKISRTVTTVGTKM